MKVIPARQMLIVENVIFQAVQKPPDARQPREPAAPFPPRHIKGTLFAQGAFNSIGVLVTYASNGFVGPSAQFLRFSV
jgi:hypothetical protein